MAMWRLQSVHRPALARPGHARSPGLAGLSGRGRRLRSVRVAGPGRRGAPGGLGGGADRLRPLAHGAPRPHGALRPGHGDRLGGGGRPLARPGRRLAPRGGAGAGRVRAGAPARPPPLRLAGGGPAVAGVGRAVGGGRSSPGRRGTPCPSRRRCCARPSRPPHPALQLPPGWDGAGGPAAGGGRVADGGLGGRAPPGPGRGRASGAGAAPPGPGGARAGAAVGGRAGAPGDRRPGRARRCGPGGRGGRRRAAAGRVRTERRGGPEGDVGRAVQRLLGVEPQDAGGPGAGRPGPGGRPGAAGGPAPGPQAAPGLAAPAPGGAGAGRRRCGRRSTAWRAPPPAPRWRWRRRRGAATPAPGRGAGEGRAGRSRRRGPWGAPRRDAATPRRWPCGTGAGRAGGAPPVRPGVGPAPGGGPPAAHARGRGSTARRPGARGRAPTGAGGAGAGAGVLGALHVVQAQPGRPGGLLAAAGGPGPGDRAPDGGPAGGQRRTYFDASRGASSAPGASTAAGSRPPWPGGRRSSCASQPRPQPRARPLPAAGLLRLDDHAGGGAAPDGDRDGGGGGGGRGAGERVHLRRRTGSAWSPRRRGRRWWPWGGSCTPTGAPPSAPRWPAAAGWLARQPYARRRLWVLLGRAVERPRPGGLTWRAAGAPSSSGTSGVGLGARVGGPARQLPGGRRLRLALAVPQRGRGDSSDWCAGPRPPGRPPGCFRDGERLRTVRRSRYTPLVKDFTRSPAGGRPGAPGAGRAVGAPVLQSPPCARWAFQVRRRRRAPALSGDGSLASGGGGVTVRVRRDRRPGGRACSWGSSSTGGWGRRRPSFCSGCWLGLSLSVYLIYVIYRVQVQPSRGDVRRGRRRPPAGLAGRPARRPTGTDSE